MINSGTGGGNEFETVSLHRGKLRQSLQITLTLSPVSVVSALTLQTAGCREQVS